MFIISKNFVFLNKVVKRRTNTVLSGIKTEMKLALKDSLMVFFLCCFALCPVVRNKNYTYHL